MKNDVVFLTLAVMMLATSCRKDSITPNNPGSNGSQTINVNTDSLSKIPKGTKLTVKTVWTGYQPIDLQAEFVGACTDMIAPLSLYMVKGTDPRFINLKGAAEGMSGSPIIINDKIIGALSYGYSGQQGDSVYFFFTALKDMKNPPYALGYNSGKKAAMKVTQNFEPISTPLIISGAKIDNLVKLGEKFPGFGKLNVMTGGTTTTSVEPIAGGSISACVIIGDQITAGAVGTITYISPSKDTLWAFGHPFLGVGTMECPFSGAEVTAEVSDISSSFKQVNVSKTVQGAIIYDGLTGIKGLINRIPQMLGVNCRLTMPDGISYSFHHQVIKGGLNNSNASYFAAVAAYVPLMDIINDGLGHSLVAEINMKFNETDKTVNQRVIMINNSDISLLSWAASQQMMLFNDLGAQPFQKLTVSSLEVDCRLTDTVKSATITNLTVDTTDIRKTKKFTATVTLVGDHSGQYQKVFALSDSLASVMAEQGLNLDVSASAKQFDEPTSLSEYFNRVNAWYGLTTLEIMVDLNYPTKLTQDWDLKTIINGDKSTYIYVPAP